ncbi:uncharacterized protein EV422DRAFT_409985 [Fimicolochytrium jonesii]|uniref:uncharacterized protein n=1 Tax=Fimicolochytrium jonesii TaxID=1396493 RepID=UPI0022FDD5D9|nr:uncharacterized protein EV422DRAFT_409985 [Fimicolochytrium jonesii]KAI8822688.1 hypothetical protein EV422DRAFT_409985 [Fimicolochytrium jonesii]
MATDSKQACLIMGATGAVGKTLLREIMQQNKYDKVTLLVRRSANYDGPNKEKVVERIVDFEKLDEEVFRGHATFFCTFGTTKAQAGSAEAFERIDKGYVLTAATLFKTANPTTPLHFLYVSSSGIERAAWFLYPRTKLAIERGLKDLQFAQCSIFRPAFLVTEQNREGRMADNLLRPVLGGWLGRVTGSATPVGAVAKAMIRAARGDVPAGVPVKAEGGFRIFENPEILAL